MIEGRDFTEIVQATVELLPTISEIVQTTIDAIYPKYYLAGAVAFFKAHHSEENILVDIECGRVYVL